MKNINSLKLAVVAIVLTSASFVSCQKEPSFSALDSRYISVAVSSENTVQTKSVQNTQSETVVLSEGPSPLYLTMSSAVNMESMFDAPVMTKGSIVTDDTMKAGGFPVWVYNGSSLLFGDYTLAGESGPNVPAGREYWSLYKTNGGTKTADKAEWPSEDATLDFWSYCTGGASLGSELSNMNLGKADYAAADGNTAAALKDVVVAHSQVQHQHDESNLDKNYVTLHYYHALAAIRFKISEGVTIKKVSVNNVVNNGSFEYKDAATEVDGKFAWTLGSTKGSYSSEKFYVSGDNSEEVTFFFVPQAVNGSDITMTFDIADPENSGQTYQVTAKANKLGSDWKAGYIYYYTIATNPDGNVNIEIQETFASNKKSNVYVQNLYRSTVYVRAAVVANWVNEAGKVVSSYTGSFANENWKLAGDGFYYSAKPIAGYTDSANLIDTFNKPTTGAPEGCHLEMRIFAQAVEYDQNATAGNRSIDVAWKNSLNEAVINTL